jgi:FAD/FMN-containing dehydrogenases
VMEKDMHAEAQVLINNQQSTIHVSPDDQTLTVSADTPLLDVYAALPPGLFPPFPPVELPGGVGGLVSRGGFGQNFFFGAEVLGVTFRAPSGRVVKAGGRTVKNVQGYDLTRPFVGSFGALGEALEIHLRLRPGLCMRHVAASGRLADLPPTSARFVWEAQG